jgi:hypothetical protein
MVIDEHFHYSQALSQLCIYNTCSRLESRPPRARERTADASERGDPDDNILRSAARARSALGELP